MGPSEKAFQQVRSILGKLDANIEQMRAQRIRPAVQGAGGGTIPADRTIGGGPPPPNTPRTGNALPAAQPARAPGIYGRATPIIQPKAK